LPSNKHNWRKDIGKYWSEGKRKKKR
jgi:hypothetical protein